MQKNPHILLQQTKSDDVVVVTSKSPCLLASVAPSRLQKLMCDFPQVTIRFASIGWNTAASTESLEHCKNAKVHLAFRKNAIKMDFRH